MFSVFPSLEPAAAGMVRLTATNLGGNTTEVEVTEHATTEEVVEAIATAYSARRIGALVDGEGNIVEDTYNREGRVVASVIQRAAAA